MGRVFRRALQSLVLFSFVPATITLFAADPAGHWQGALRLPDGEIGIEVDLAKNDKGAWVGTINIPPQGVRNFPLANITVQTASVSFLMKGIPGDPTFRGTLSADGKSIAGDFTQGGAALSFEMKRVGEAKIEAPGKSTAIGKELEGAWEGTLDASGTLLRLVLKMANQTEGTAAGTLVSLDQGGVEIPISTITQSGSNLKFEVKTIDGSYTGELNKERSQLVGEWSQRGATFPLIFKRAAKSENKK